MNNFSTQTKQSINQIKKIKTTTENKTQDNQKKINIDPTTNNLLKEVLSHQFNQTQTILFTVKEVAALIKSNIDYVHSLRKAKLLPFIKLGQYKVRKQALLDFIAKYEGYDLTNPFDIKEIVWNNYVLETEI